MDVPSGWFITPIAWCDIGQLGVRGRRQEFGVVASMGNTGDAHDNGYHPPRHSRKNRIELPVSAVSSGPGVHRAILNI